jgi:uncharacterized protein YutE (UPF0331/DUF86 family)
MVRPEVIRRRLEKFAGYLAILDRLRGYGEQEFIADPERYGSAERFLQVAIESLLDMGSHVIADEGGGSVNQSRDIPAYFRKCGWIDAALERKWIDMIGFRNVLVHEYTEVDLHIVYDVLQNRLDDFRRIERMFARFL